MPEPSISRSRSRGRWRTAVAAIAGIGGAGHFGCNRDFSPRSAAKTLALPPTSPQSLFAGDLNGDGRVDLAVVSYSSPVTDNLAVLLNQGGGNFAPAVTYPAGEFLMSVAGDDLNGDGWRDLAVVDSTSNIAVLMNRGDGSFAAPVSLGPDHPSSAIALGDVTGDGRVDIVSAESLRYQAAGWVFGDVSVLVNGGNAAFGSGIDFTDEPIEGAIVLGDLNGDGKLDVVARNRTYDCKDSISVLLNTSP